MRSIVGRRHVLTGEAGTRAFATGCRFGGGPVLAVVRPGTPWEQYQAFCACVAAGVVVIAQAANTGLTGGSTPDGRYDRPVVIINTRRIDGIHLIRGGRQAVCLAGATLDALERRLATVGREPHSVIGSSCIGASVVGGVCNNSGGALVRRGPAYTEYALYARVDEGGEVELVNHLGIALAGGARSVLSSIEEGRLPEELIVDDGRRASASGYADQVRDVDAATPARFNADPRHLFEAAGCAGKVMVLAVRLDTFPRDERTTTFYIGTNDTVELARLRRRLLRDLTEPPVSGEYVHRGAFDLAARYGKDTFLVVERLGTARLPALFACKRRIDAIAKRLSVLPADFADRTMQLAGKLFGPHLPARMIQWRDRYEHHLILKVAGDGVDEAHDVLADIFPSASGDTFECTEEEARKAFLHRFVVAGAAIRYRAIHSEEVEDIIALDLALRRNDEDWFENLPAEIADGIVAPVYYGHFLCHVLHQDYLVRKGIDPVALEHRMLEILAARGAEYPAEHNVGHLYPAKPALAVHYRALDPTNTLNPGIGKTSRERNWG